MNDAGRFNLLTEKWIPVLRTNGRAERVGVLTALREAGKIRQIAASNPLDNVALLRFLLAVMLWCRPEMSEADRVSLEGAAGVPGGWLEKLETHRATFDLLGDGERFMQAPAEATNDRPIADLYHELPGDTNKAHFRHIRDYRDGACPGCIAIGLVRLPVAITGKGAGKRPGINGDPPLYFVPVEHTLLGTLMLNWPLSIVQGDRPCWLKGDQPVQEQIGIMEGFTWTSRQFRIPGEPLKNGTCIVCGARTHPLVVGLKELNKPNGRDGLSRCDANRWRDPHIIYTEENKPWQAEDAEKNLPGSSGQWRDWLSGLCPGTTDALKRPEAVSTAADRSNGRVVVLVAGLAMQSNDKTTDSIACTRSLNNIDGDYPVMIKLLGNAIGALLDPAVALTGKKLASFNQRHPLRKSRPGDRLLTQAARAALADRLPDVEAAVYKVVCVERQCEIGAPRRIAAVTGWRAVYDDVVKVLTPGSPLRRYEAMSRTRLAFDESLRNATAEQASPLLTTAINDKTAGVTPKSKRPGTKKGGDT